MKKVILKHIAPIKQMLDNEVSLNLYHLHYPYVIEKVVEFLWNFANHKFPNEDLKISLKDLPSNFSTHTPLLATLIDTAPTGIKGLLLLKDNISIIIDKIFEAEKDSEVLEAYFELWRLQRVAKDYLKMTLNVTDENSLKEWIGKWRQLDYDRIAYLEGEDLILTHRTKAIKYQGFLLKQAQELGIKPRFIEDKKEEKQNVGSDNK